jgi:hypothetical protein
MSKRSKAIRNRRYYCRKFPDVQWRWPSGAPAKRQQVFATCSVQYPDGSEEVGKPFDISPMIKPTHGPLEDTLLAIRVVKDNDCGLMTEISDWQRPDGTKYHRVNVV